MEVCIKMQGHKLIRELSSYQFWKVKLNQVTSSEFVPNYEDKHMQCSRHIQKGDKHP